MNKTALFLILLLLVSLAQAITLADSEFCLKKELWPILDKHIAAIRDSALVSPGSSEWLQLYLRIAEHHEDSLSVLGCLQKKALQFDDFDSAVNWLNIADDYALAHPDYNFITVYNAMTSHFSGEADRFLLNAYQTGASEDSLYSGIAGLKEYNSYIEDLAKALLDMISVERSDSVAFALTNKFYETFPYSKWNQAVYYFELAHFAGKAQYEKFFSLINEKAHKSQAHTYLTTVYLLSPNLRRELDRRNISYPAQEKALAMLDSLRRSTGDTTILYDTYTPQHWQARLDLQQAKALFYQIVKGLGFYGDEDSLVAIIKKPNTSWQKAISVLDQISFTNNDSGEQAELLYWKGKLHALLTDKASLLKASRYFAQCLVKGSPRKKYDIDALSYTRFIHDLLKIRMNLMDWQRQLVGYKGTTFNDISESAGFIKNREARVALGDYDNDGFCDILLNGKRLYHNNGNITFTELTDTLGLGKLYSNGGLFADFNCDGKLDFMTTSNGEDGNGERLMKNNGDRFFPVNERAGDIDDTYPTEGAAWIDCFNDQYPDLYCANYEKWNVQSGYVDRFWNNEKGYFTDTSKDFGFLTPDYTTSPGQAGRGVAPADFDNDGVQEIYVTNYRLDRNFLWDRQDTTFTDIAALNDLQGIYKNGYYGHSIGADWGDFDNDGDLDLFVANLAHPRYIDISDISMLLRNDGKKLRVVEGDTITYWQFTDITKQAGITYDELHSDPLWFDADNDGFLDLFITSVYENDRSYLYHNNGDGTFTDITWLAGVRVYNGWGNAYADLNHDNRLDLVVGSGNGTKVFLNSTQNKNNGIILKPVWDKGTVNFYAYSEVPAHPNSPAFSARLKLIEAGKNNGAIRELCSAKGTTSQNEQIIHFGIGSKKSAQFMPYPFSNKIIKCKAKRK